MDENLKKVTASLLLVGIVAVSSMLVKKVGAQNVGAGTALRFYGHGVSDIDRVKIRLDGPATKADVGGDFTLEWWMKASLSQNGGTVSCSQNDGWITGNILFDRDIYGGGDYGDYGVSLGSGKIGFGVSLGNQGTVVCGSRMVADGSWHHIAITRSSAGPIRIFVDGVLDGTGVGPSGDISYRNGRSSGWPNSDPYLVIAAEKHDAGSEYPSYNGEIDEVRLSSGVRYATAFQRPTTPFTADGSTLLLYHFDEGSDLTLVDSSVNPLNGLIRFGGSSTPGPVYVVSGAPISGTTPTNSPTPSPSLAPTLVPTNSPGPLPTSVVPTPTIVIVPTATPPASGNVSLLFDGVNDLVRIVDIPLGGVFTAEAWVRRSVDRGTYETFLSDANSSYSQAGVTLYIDGGSLDCGSGDQFAYYQPNSGVQCSGVPILVGRWYHLAVVRDSSGVRRMYVDGVMSNSRTGSVAPSASSGRLTVGRAGDFAGEYFSGLIDEVRISSSARYSAGFVPVRGSLVSDSQTVGLWKFDEGSGQVVGDSSANRRNGVLGTSSSIEATDPVWNTSTP